jgi:hypothetical protein
MHRTLHQHPNHYTELVPGYVAPNVQTTHAQKKPTPLRAGFFYLDFQSPDTPMPTLLQTGIGGVAWLKESEVVITALLFQCLQRRIAHKEKPRLISESGFLNL